MKPIAVIGEGGHSKVIRDIIEATGKYGVICILDDKYRGLTSRNGISFAPVSYSLQLIKESNPAFVVAIGNNRVRKRIAEELAGAGAGFATLVHPSAVISPSARLGEGTVVMPKSVINANTVIGNHVIINTSSIIEHDNLIGDYVHVSPGAVLTGNVQVGTGAQVGAGSTIIPGKKIGKGSIIGAGSTIIRDIPDYVTAAGTPAKIIKQTDQ